MKRLARGPRRLGQHHPVLHRRGQGRRQVLPDHEGQADRHGLPRAHRRRLRRRPHLRARHGLHVRRVQGQIKLASETYAKGIVGYTEDAVVSSDFVGSTDSTTFDAGAGIMLTPTFVKLVSWYDNEWGYSTRLVDLVANMAAKDGVVAKEK